MCVARTVVLCGCMCVCVLNMQECFVRARAQAARVMYVRVVSCDFFYSLMLISFVCDFVCE